jgi:hypothetical protein
MCEGLQSGSTGDQRALKWFDGGSKGLDGASKVFEGVWDVCTGSYVIGDGCRDQG